VDLVRPMPLLSVDLLRPMPLLSVLQHPWLEHHGEWKRNKFLVECQF
jgi:hypothetical protein